MQTRRSSRLASSAVEAEYESAMQTSRSRKRALEPTEERVASLEEQIASLQTQVSAVEGERNNLRDQAERLTVILNEYQNGITSLLDGQHEIKEGVVRMSAELADARERIESQDDVIKHLHDEVSTLEDKLSAAGEREEELKEELREAGKREEELMSQDNVIKHLHDQVSTLEDKLTAASEREDELQAKFDDVTARLAKETSDKELQEKFLTALSDERLRLLTVAGEGEARAIRELDQIKAALTSERDAATKRSIELCASLNSKMAQCDRLEKELDNIRGLLEDATVKLQQERHRNSEQDKELADTRCTNEQLRQFNASNSRMLQEATNNFERINRDRTMLITKIDKLTAELKVQKHSDIVSSGEIATLKKKDERCKELERQVSDLKVYYEKEIEKLHVELFDTKASLDRNTDWRTSDSSLATIQAEIACMSGTMFNHAVIYASFVLGYLGNGPTPLHIESYPRQAVMNKLRPSIQIMVNKVSDNSALPAEQQLQLIVDHLRSIEHTLAGRTVGVLFLGMLQVTTAVVARFKSLDG